MKIHFTLLAILFSCSALSQIPVTSVSTTNTPTPVSTTYTNTAADTTYNWGVSPNNTTQLLTGFTAGGLNYGFGSGLTGIVKLRRADNLLVTGNFSLIWAEFIQSGTNVFNMFPAYQNDMEPFFNNHIYNKGTDNFFDNTSLNSNNIERLDWILAGGYSTPSPGKIGFAVFDRGPSGGHDPFCIAAITSLDGGGNPSAYGTLLRVTTPNFGNPVGSAVTYKIVKGPVGSNLLEAGGNTQDRGGSYISLASLGIAANTVVYGYSLFANDLPMGASSADMVDFNNTINFPTNTSTVLGGIDLIAVTGIYVDLSILPVRFTSFDAVENNNIILLKWKVENEILADKYGIERSQDGIHFFTINEMNATGTNTYSNSDNVTALLSNQLYYRIKQYDNNGSFYFSKVLAINRSKRSSAIIIYPNPVADNLFINITAAINDKTTITVSNSLGAQVIIQQVQLTNGTNSCTINGVDRLPAGVYQISITGESGKTVTTQFIKN